MTEELCAGCRHKDGPYCSRPVTGDYEYCATQRSQGWLGARLSNRCGAEARFYERVRNRSGTDDAGLKLKMFALLWRHPVEWYRDVWLRDADDRMCCNGHHCGCRGSCYGEYWRHLWADRDVK